MITVQNYREATESITVPAELQAGHEYTLSYLDLYDQKMSLEEANELLAQMGREPLPYNVEVSDVIDAHIAALNSAVNGGNKAKSTVKKSKALSPEVAEWKEAIETLQMLIDEGAGGKSDIAAWKEAIETLQMLIDQA